MDDREGNATRGCLIAISMSLIFWGVLGIISFWLIS